MILRVATTVIKTSHMPGVALASTPCSVSRQLVLSVQPAPNQDSGTKEFKFAEGGEEKGEREREREKNKNNGPV